MSSQRIPVEELIKRIQRNEDAKLLDMATLTPREVIAVEQRTVHGQPGYRIIVRIPPGRDQRLSPAFNQNVFYTRGSHVFVEK